jgi:hypothetical protein
MLNAGTLPASLFATGPQQATRTLFIGTMPLEPTWKANDT